MMYAIRLRKGVWLTGGPHGAKTSHYALQFSSPKDAQIECDWAKEKGGFTEAKVVPIMVNKRK